eukprot:g5848.t1
MEDRRANIESMEAGRSSARGLGSSAESAFPRRAIIVLALCMAVHAYTFVSLFPYVGTMVTELLDLNSSNNSGFYAGYVAGAFTLGRFLTGYFWGYFSDSFGRKPVVVIALSATALLSLTFGLSQTYRLAILSRFVLGMLNGMTPAIRTITYEVCGTNQHVVQAMAYMDGARAATFVLGSAMGGLLVQPADHYPGVFSSTGLFRKFPFLLPNLVGVCSALLMLPIVIAYVPETLGFEKIPPRSRSNSASSGGATSDLSTEEDVPARNRVAARHAHNGRGTSGLAYESLEDDNHGNDGIASQELGEGRDAATASGGRVTGSSMGKGRWVPSSFSQPGGNQGLWWPGGLLSVPRVKPLLFLVCIVQSLLTGFEEVYPLWALSTVGVGGLSWGTVEIGKVLLMTGVIMAVAQLVIFPPVIKILGAVKWMRIGCLLGIFTFLAIPNVTFFNLGYSELFAMSVAGVTVVNCCLAAVSIALAVASTSIVPSSMRGTLGGLYGTAESFGRFTNDQAAVPRVVGRRNPGRMRDSGGDLGVSGGQGAAVGRGSCVGGSERQRDGDVAALGGAFVEDGITLMVYGTEAGGDADELRLLSTNETFVNLRAHGGNLDFANSKVRGFCEDKSNPEVFDNVNVYGNMYNSDVHHMRTTRFMAGVRLPSAGIFLHRSSDDATVKGNYVHDNGDAGLAMLESFGAHVSENTFENNKYGVRFSVGCGDNVFFNITLRNSTKYNAYSYLGSDLQETVDSGRSQNNVFSHNTIGNAGLDLEGEGFELKVAIGACFDGGSDSGYVPVC